VLGDFATFVRNEQGPESDVDILLAVPEDAGLDLLDLVRLQNELTDLLGVRADIALKRNLRKRIGERSLQEVAGL
jgi:predicted nucleotidyltransferase